MKTREGEKWANVVLGPGGTLPWCWDGGGAPTVDFGSLRETQGSH